ncbi:histone H4-like TAF Taf6, SAGA complex subunit [Basidiobolus ranarum]|uniref:Histone H4-like TAF Taf6, SAGA complex subunit n=1 Tax=Basidiobolus ranarum TaxID=34480 RepID=A0ABR2X1F7_9FUNG
MSIYSKDTIKHVAESVGISNLKDDVASALCQDVEYRLHEIIQEGIRFMRHSKREKLTVEDINNALRVRNVEPLYGFNSASGDFRFKTTNVNNHDIFYLDDEELDFDSILSAPLPKIAPDVTYTAHWLAIEGVQPAISRNPAPGESKVDILEKKVKPEVMPKANNNEPEVKPLVKHVLSKELQLYFERITNAIFSDEDTLRATGLSSLSTDPGLHQLLPYFVQFISEKVTQNMKKLKPLESSLSMIKSILDNPNLFVEPYLHQIMPPLLSCLVGKKLGESPQVDHWGVRKLAAKIVGIICSKYGQNYHTLQPRVTKTLLRAFLDPTKPLTTHYGAIIGLSSLGNEIIKILIVPNLKPYGTILGQQLESTNATKKQEAEKCHSALMDAIKSLKEFPDLELLNNPELKSLDQDELEKRLDEKVGVLFSKPIAKEPSVAKYILDLSI